MPAREHPGLGQTVASRIARRVVSRDLGLHHLGLVLAQANAGLELLVHVATVAVLEGGDVEAVGEVPVEDAQGLARRRMLPSSQSVDSASGKTTCERILW